MRDLATKANTVETIWQWIDRILDRIWIGVLVATALYLAIHGILAKL